MASLEVGKICLKIAGRESGKYACILKKLDDTFVLITGPKQLTGIKRRRCNIEHLEPTPYSIKIKPEASDSEVIKAYDAIGLTKKLSLRLPSPEVMKEVEKKVKEIPKEVVKLKVVKKPEKPKKEEEKPVEKPKREKPPEKPKEEKPKKKGITIKFKIPTLRKKKPKEEKKVVMKPEKKIVKGKKKVAKKAKKSAKKAKKKK